MAWTPTHRRRRIEVEAIQWTGSNLAPVVRFLGDALVVYDHGEIRFVVSAGEITCVPGQWIVREEAAGLLPDAYSQASFDRLFELLPTV